MDVSLIGFAAGALTTTAWIPQLFRTWRSRSADDISWPYLLTTGTGITFWILYGAVDGDAALVATNVVTLTLIASQVWLKASVSRERRTRALALLD